MYEDYLRNRILSYGNGVSITLDFATLPPDTETGEVIYRVHHDGVTTCILFANIALTTVGYANGIANLTNYGRELLDLGADSVTVDVFDHSFICIKNEKVTKEDMCRALIYLSWRVSDKHKPGSHKIELWCQNSDFGTMEVWYAPPRKSAHKKQYLANLGGYLSKLFGTPVQLGRRDSKLTTETEVLDE